MRRVTIDMVKKSIDFFSSTGFMNECTYILVKFVVRKPCVPVQSIMIIKKNGYYAVVA